jgi:hypothetical protein
MNRLSLSPLLAASSLLLACPPLPADDTGTASESASEGSSTTGPDDPTVSSTPPTQPSGTTEDTNTTMGMSESNSQTGPDTEPTETAPTSTTSDPGCRGDDECGGDKPFCVDGECVDCSGAPDPGVACAGADESTPVCLDGTCVECTPDSKELCDGNTPVCDPDTNTCAACSFHADCPDSACNFDSGACFDPSYVVYVDRLAADCLVGDGTLAMPFCKVSEALAKIAGDDPTLGWTVKIKSGNYLEEPLNVPDTALLTLSGWEGVPKLRALDDSGATLTISNGSTVYIDRIAFNSNDSNIGVVCEGSTVHIDDSRIAANKLQGYNSTDCESHLRRTVVFDNDGGGIASYGVGATWLWNSYVSGNGTQNFGDFGGIRSAQGNELHLIYTSVINNLSETGPRSLHCTDDASPAEIRNSVIIGFALPSVDCLAGTFSNSALDEGAMDGDTNLAATFMDIMNFFDPPVQGVYKAKQDTALANIAKWQDGDPKTDFDGDARPSSADSPDYAGADRPTP